MASRRVSGLLAAMLFAGVLASPSTALSGSMAATAPAAASSQSADLAPALAADGTFVGAEGLSGTVDASAWALVSDLAAGEPPRFAPAAAAASAVSPDGTEWLALGSNPAGTDGALNSNVNAVVVSVNSVIVGGNFLNAGGEPKADYIARWNGDSWSALGSNVAGTDGALNGPVTALLVSGTNLFVGGSFTNVAGIAQADNLAVWNGTWAALGANTFGTDGALNSIVRALAGSSANLYVGGNFTNAAGFVAADYVARWDGTWHPLGSLNADGALNDQVYALATSGSSVYVGGAFTNAAGDALADRVARFGGSSWSALGSNAAGTDGSLNGKVLALAVSGADVYAGGEFTNAGGVLQADRIARFNTVQWLALGQNNTGDGALNGIVHALSFEGDDLYVGGQFTNAADITTADRVARWNANGWSTVGSNSAGTDGAVVDAVFALDVAGSAVYVGGFVTNVAGITTADSVVLAVVPGPWSALGENSLGNGALNNLVDEMVISGGNLIVGGGFTDAAGIPAADFIARWDGTAWHALGSNPAGTDGALNASVHALAVSGTNVFAGGSFTNAAGKAKADFLARWDGSGWFALGANAAGTDGALNDVVVALAVSGGNVFAGGVFTNAAGKAKADNVARWDGSSWFALGSNPAGTDGALNGGVHTLAVSGSDVFVGGVFTNAAGKPKADFLARWNGSAWSALGSNAAGTDGALDGASLALTTLGTDLFVGGLFTNAAGLAKADYLARWNGSAWSALGSNTAGTDGALNGEVNSLSAAAGDLYASGGFFAAAGILGASHIARWNGSAWLALDSNASGSGAIKNDFGAFAMTSSGSTLFVGGPLLNVDGIPMADFVAAYGPIPEFQPDGRIRKGSGSLLGNDTYNSTGANQTAKGSAAIGSTVTFTLSIQNDGNQSDRIQLVATGAATSMYTVTYFDGSTDITSAVAGGTYRTPFLAPGATKSVTVKVKVESSASSGSSVARVVTLSSIGEPGKIDAVKLTVKRS